MDVCREVCKQDIKTMKVSIFGVLLIYLGSSKLVNGKCPDGWSSYQSHCYYYVNSSKMPWQAAENYCKCIKNTIIQTSL